MEHDEIAVLWKEMSVKLNTQITLSERIILDVTQNRLEKKVSIFRNSQILSFIMAYGLIGILLFNLTKLHTWIEVTSAILWLVYLATMPFYMNMAIRALNNIDIVKLTYKQNLSLFYKSRRRLVRAQGVSLALNPLLFVGAVVLIFSLFLNADIRTLASNRISVSILSITLVVTMCVLYAVYKKSNAYLSSLQEFIQES